MLFSAYSRFPSLDDDSYRFRLSRISISTQPYQYFWCFSIRKLKNASKAEPPKLWWIVTDYFDYFKLHLSHEHTAVILNKKISAEYQLRALIYNLLFITHSKRRWKWWTRNVFLYGSAESIRFGKLFNYREINRILIMPKNL